MSAPVVSGFTEGTQLPLLPPPRRNVSSLSKLEKGIGPGVDLHQDIQVREINGVILASCDRGEGWYSCRDLSRDCDSRHHEQSTLSHRCIHVLRNQIVGYSHSANDHQQQGPTCGEGQVIVETIC